MTASGSDSRVRHASRLSAVWFADIVGYTRLSAHDAPAALRLVDVFQTVVREALSEHEGRLVKFIGDAALAEFTSSSVAVRCADGVRLRFAEACRSQGLAAKLRIGVHVGEVTVGPDDDVYGDGVNTASRLQAAAEPGQLLVSEDVFRQLRRYPEFSFEYAGEKKLRGLASPLVAYAVEPASSLASRTATDTLRRRLRRLRSGRPSRRLISVALVAALLVAGYAVWTRLQVSSAVAESRVVVLPFRNLGPPEEEYFADGLTEEIIDRLSSIGRLAVIARTSAMTYRDTDKAVPQIADELGVGYLIEGTVRWGSVGRHDSLRVTARLVRASGETQVWNADYDVALGDIFQVQADIAESVAAALDLVLLEPERRQIEARLTDNPEAYDAYLRGNVFYNRSWSRSDVDSAVVYYQRATQLDPGFALAFAALGRTHAWMYQLGHDRDHTRLDLALRAAEHAVGIDPDLPEALVALGLHQYWGLGNLEAAIGHLTRAQALQPNNAGTLRQIGNVRRRQGLFDEALESYRRSVNLDPRSHLAWFNIADTYLFMRRYDLVERVLVRVNSLAPFFVEGHVQRARLAVNSRGDIATARRIISEARQRVPASDWRLDLVEFALTYSEDPEALLADLHPAFRSANLWFYHDARATLYWIRGQQDSAGLYYDSAAAELNLQREGRADTPAWIHGAMGRAYAGSGRAEEGIHAARLAVQAVPVSRDVMDAPVHIANLAQVYIMAGRTDEALDQLELALSMPSWISPRSVALDPRWRSLHRFQRFQELVRERP